MGCTGERLKGSGQLTENQQGIHGAAQHHWVFQAFLVCDEGRLLHNCGLSPSIHTAILEPSCHSQDQSQVISTGTDLGLTSSKHHLCAISVLTAGTGRLAWLGMSGGVGRKSLLNVKRSRYDITTEAKDGG